jgi:hypothetical protein
MDTIEQAAIKETMKLAYINKLHKMTKDELIELCMTQNETMTKGLECIERMAKNLVNTNHDFSNVEKALIDYFCLPNYDGRLKLMLKEHGF